MDQLKDYLTKHRWAIILAVVGVLYVLLCMQIGFWRTLLLTAIAVLCAYLGSCIDKKRDNDE